MEAPLKGAGGGAGGIFGSKGQVPPCVLFCVGKTLLYHGFFKAIYLQIEDFGYINSKSLKQWNCSILSDLGSTARLEKIFLFFAAQKT